MVPVLLRSSARFSFSARVRWKIEVGDHGGLGSAVRELALSKPLVSFMNTKVDLGVFADEMAVSIALAMSPALGLHSPMHLQRHLGSAGHDVEYIGRRQGRQAGTTCNLYPAPGFIDDPALNAKRSPEACHLSHSRGMQLPVGLLLVLKSNEKR